MTEYNEAIHMALERDYHPRRWLISKYRRLRREWLQEGHIRIWRRIGEHEGVRVMKIEHGKATVARTDVE